MSLEKIDANIKIQNALISVSDKAKLEDFVVGLLGINPDLMIYPTGGTFKEIYKWIGDDNLTQVSEYTGQPELAEGLVKTLHHKIALGLLTKTYSEPHQEALERENTFPINLVVCNLYPFSDVVGRGDATFEDAIKNIDIGGVQMIRAAAKNHRRVGVVVDPFDYDIVLQELERNNGLLSLDTRFRLMKKAFGHIAKYDVSIDCYMGSVEIDDMKKCYEIVGDK